MTPEQLINEAKKHVCEIHPTGGNRLSLNDFPKVKLQDTAMISFESDTRTDQVCVFLERESGRFVTVMYWNGIGRPSAT